VQSIIPQLTRRYVTYGFASQADLVASDVVADAEGVAFRVRRRGEALGSVRTRMRGRHNVRNALATIGVAQELEVPFDTIADALAGFVGIERRFQHIGDVRGVRVVDDYAHHPAEIVATLASARESHGGRIVAAFQPHRYTRTRDVWEEYLSAFNDADVLFVTEIYGAGEDKIPGVEAAALVDAIRAHGHHDARYVADLAGLQEALAAEARAGDLVLTLGAGSIASLGAALVERLGGDDA